ncbi:MAG: Ppx/GppA family phosphatase, partial [Burkholderiales bacterium]|nr:Ppx/GppA family phosphatase [Burkholderiales bacterium]
SHWARPLCCSRADRPVAESGEEEGRLIYMGVANTLATEQERRLVIDIGGGSTELIVGCGLDIEYVESFSIGTFKQGPTFFPNGDITEEGFDAAILSARSNFQDHPAAFDPKNWQNAYGSSGTIRSIAEIIAKNEIGSGLLNKKSMLALKQRFIASGNMSKISFPGLRPDRVSAVVGGLAVLIGLCDELGIALVNPIEAGLRMGVLWDLYLRSTQRDRREISVRSFLHKFNADQARAQRVADDAAFLFTKLKPVADDDMQKHLEWAALLHEVGMNVSHTNYHKHSSYIVENADLPGFTNAEQKLMGRLILGQKGNLRKIGDLHETPDFLKALLALRISVIFLHSRLEVNFEQLRIRVKSKIELEFANNWLQAHPTASYWLEKEREWWGQVGIEFVIKSAV